MEINCEQKYNEAIEYAQKLGDKSLQNCLDRLKGWEADGRSTVQLYNDSSPYSFYFQETRKDGSRGLNGGVLYHGNPDQSFAVTMDRTNAWQIHT